MLSFRHEILVDLFRGNGQLAPELLRACAGIAVDHARVALESIDLTQVAPTAYHPDAVAVLRDRDDRPVTGVIVEVQLREDKDKLLSWPVYVSTLRAKLACAAMLLVIARDPNVATWARQPIELVHPGFRLTPVVIEFDDVPWVRDRAAASRLPELAMLSMMAHSELYKDVAFRATSVSDRDAADMLDHLRGRQLLDGFRGAPAADRPALIDLLQRISALIEIVPEMVELDLNPVICHALGEGCVAVDGRIRTERATRPRWPSPCRRWDGEAPAGPVAPEAAAPGTLA